MITVRPSWPDGPLRQWSDVPNSRWIPCATGGYYGSYVCVSCRKEVMGVYHVDNKWVCSNCKPGRGGKVPRGLAEYQRTRKTQGLAKQKGHHND